MMIYADIPYQDPANQGTQDWYGNLALQFQVWGPISVTSLGVFNASGTGTITTGPITVGIYDLTTSTLITSISFPTGSYTHQGFDVFQSITPVVLSPGLYEVDAVGFSGTDKNGNLNTGSSSGPTLDTLGGHIAFQGAAWDYSTTLDYPTTCPSCVSGAQQSQQFDAGTFNATPIPEPGFYESLGGLWVTSGGLLLAIRRRSRKA
jgi:hypothetical protein